MNSRRLAAAVVFTTCLAVLATAAGSSATPGRVHCNKLKGKLTAMVVGPLTTQGTITGDGFINGSTQDVFAPTGFNPPVLSYTSVFTDTTDHGRLVTNDVGAFDLAAGTFTESGTPDASSDGKYEGATGTIVVTGSTTDGINFTGAVTGQICVPNGP
jgi:hypothetical protein